MMRAIVLLHRWLGIAFCLLFAMWFATGIVMHFVPFPSLTEAERFAGLGPLASAGTRIAVADAVAASGIADATRVRLIQRSDGPVYVVSGPSRAGAIRASDGGDASVASSDVALAIARDHARSRGLDAGPTEIVARSDYDQWSVPNGFDRHRPLFRVALGDADGRKSMSPRSPARSSWIRRATSGPGIWSGVCCTGSIQRSCEATGRCGIAWSGPCRCWP